MPGIEARLNQSVRLHTGMPLTPAETAALARAVNVLRRVAENDCTNAQREAADIIVSLT